MIEYIRFGCLQFSQYLRYYSSLKVSRYIYFSKANLKLKCFTVKHNSINGFMPHIFTMFT